jgi:peptidyl-prolyl cis-trans isomerase C
MRKITWTLFIIFLVGCGGKVGKSKNPVVAKVNEEVITLQEFNERVSEFLGEANREEKIKFLDEWIANKLLAQEAKAIGLNKREDIIRRLNLAEEQILVEAIIQEKVTGKVKVTQKEVEKYFSSHKMDYATPEERCVSHILIKVPSDATPKMLAEAEKRAREVLRKVRAGADFATMAKRYSEEEETAEVGGYLGYFKRGELVSKEFEDTAFSLKVGEISDLVKTKFGYHIIKVEGRKPPKERPLEEVYELVRDDLLRKKRNELFIRLVKELEGKAKITKNLQLLK